MATLQEALQFSREGYSPLPQREPSPPGLHLEGNLEPVYNSFLRSPLPPIAAGSDTLRQFYVKGAVPQFRILTTSNPSTSYNSGGGTVIQNVSTTISNGGSSVVYNPQLSQASITTPVLNPGDNFATSINTKKIFTVYSAACDNAARVELYGSASAQSGDLSRGLDVAPSPGTIQGLIFDLALDTSPYQWYFQNAVANNSDSPQAPLVYITVTNIGAMSTPITVTINYLTLES